MARYRAHWDKKKRGLFVPVKFFRSVAGVIDEPQTLWVNLVHRCFEHNLHRCVDILDLREIVVSLCFSAIIQFAL